MSTEPVNANGPLAGPPIGPVGGSSPEPIDMRPSRGPLRPSQLTSIRARQARRLGSHKFRTGDLLFLFVVTTGVVLGVATDPVSQTPVAEVAPFLCGLLILARLLRSLGLYQFVRSERLVVHLARVAAVVAGSGASVMILAIVLNADEVARDAAWTWTGLCAAGVLGLHTVYWLLVRRWRADGWLTPNLFIVGATSRAEQLIRDAIERRDIHVLGVFDDRLARSPLNVLGVPLLGNTEALLNHRITPYVDLIVVTVDPTATARVREITNRLATLPNKVILLIDQDDESDRAAAVAHLTDAPLAPLSGAVDLDRNAYAKRVQDLVIGVPALILLSPLLALIAIAVKLDSPGPVFFRQRRQGFNNEEIVVWKFRTMRHEAADARAEKQVTAGDARVTRVGRILRSTSLDELPQLFNVIRDEMSLVGPRPHAIGMKTGDVESARLVAEYAHRHRMKPGMTGWAAINGSRGPLHLPAEVKRRVALDVDYIDRQSFWMDLKIMTLTIPSLLGDHETVR